MEYFEVLKHLEIQLILKNKKYMKMFDDLKHLMVPLRLKKICIWNNLATSNYSKYYCIVFKKINIYGIF